MQKFVSERRNAARLVEFSPNATTRHERLKAVATDPPKHLETRFSLHAVPINYKIPKRQRIAQRDTELNAFQDSLKKKPAAATVSLEVSKLAISNPSVVTAMRVLVGWKKAVAAGLRTREQAYAETGDIAFAPIEKIIKIDALGRVRN